MATVPKENPLKAANFRELDGQTVESWLKGNMFTTEGRAILELACRSVMGAEPNEISLLYFLFYLHSSMGPNYVTQVSNGAQQDFIVGGTQQISLKLAALLKNQVTLETPVTKVTQSEEGVLVESAVSGEVRHFEARYCVLACPPSQLRRLTYEPRLPVAKSQLYQRMFMGSYIKVYTRYSTGFWRTQGFSGEVFCVGDKTEISFVYDCSLESDSFFALAVFITGAKQAISFQTKSEAARREMVLSHLVKYFGKEAATPTHYFEKDWQEEPYIGGAPVDIIAPGALCEFGEELRKPFGKLFFAGTETAENFCGYMSGAVEGTVPCPLSPPLSLCVSLYILLL